jgi:hypothetical protein
MRHRRDSQLNLSWFLPVTCERRVRGCVVFATALVGHGQEKINRRALSERGLLCCSTDLQLEHRSAGGEEGQ